MKYRVLVVLGLVLGCLAPTEGVIRFYITHVNSKLRSDPAAIRKVVLLPPLIAFNRIGVKGPEGMTAESDQLADGLYSVVAKELASRGVEVLPNPGALAKTDAAKYAIADLQAKYDNARVQIRRKPDRVETGAYSLGDAISTFEPARGADAVIAIRGNAIKATKGKKAALLIGYGALSTFEGDIGLVDARTGEVLAWGRMTKMGDPSKKPEQRLAECARETLRDVPLPVASPK